MLVSKTHATAHPPRNCVVSADATVPAMPMTLAVLKRRKAAGETLDFKLHHEAGGHPVFGSKFCLGSVRLVDEDGKPIENSRLILSIAHVAKVDPGGEAAVAVERLLALKERAPGMLGVRYDGAFRGKHLDELMKAGLAVIAPVHGGIKRTALERVTCAASSQNGGACGAVHELVTESGDVGVVDVVLDPEPKAVFQPLERIKISARADKYSHRWYVEVILPCGHPYRIRLTNSAKDRRRRYNRAEHIRMHPPGTDEYRETYAWRNDTESSHSELDNVLYRGRMPAHTVPRQALIMLGFAVAHNAKADWYARHRESEQ